MNIELCAEALDFGRQVSRALEAAGGDELVRLAEVEPDRRGELVEPVLGRLGAWDLDPRGGDEELEAAAAACHAAGWWSLAYPVAERLSRPRDVDAEGLVVVADAAPAGALAGLDLRWVAVTPQGARSLAKPRPTIASARESAFVTALDLTPLDGAGIDDAALGLVLSCFTLLGMLDRAVDLARAHARVRTQFGRPLAEFQGVRFQLTDAEVERAGLELLCRHALWSIQAGTGDELADALALRLAAVEAATTVFRVAHQVHGAVGFCDESQLSWVSRYSRPLQRLPLGPAGLLAELTRVVGRRGLTDPFANLASFDLTGSP